MPKQAFSFSKSDRAQRSGSAEELLCSQPTTHTLCSHEPDVHFRCDETSDDLLSSFAFFDNNEKIDVNAQKIFNLSSSQTMRCCWSSTYIMLLLRYVRGGKG